MNRAAQALGRMAKGVPKTLTDDQRQFRAAQLAAARLKRHKKPKRKAGNAGGMARELAAQKPESTTDLNG